MTILRGIMRASTEDKRDGEIQKTELKAKDKARGSFSFSFILL